MSVHELLGAWSLERTIEDRHTGERLDVTGTAVLERLADGRVCWREQGTLRARSRAPAPVSRTLYVVPPGDAQDGDDGEDGEPAWVTFEDGRAFHPWSPGVEVDHWCAPDDYRGLVETDALPEVWTVRWRCRGPAKDYTTTTTYRPLRQADDPTGSATTTTLLS